MGQPMARLFVMVGIPGSGKTSIARERFGDALRVSPDDLRLMLTGKTFELRREPIVERITRAVLETLLAIAQAQGLDVLHDATDLTRARRRPLIKLARQHGLTPVAVFVRCDLATALARNSRRPHPVPPTIVKRMHALLQEPSVEEGFEEVIEIHCAEE